MGVTRRIPRHQFVRCRDDTCPILQSALFHLFLYKSVLTLFIFIGWADQETQCMWQKASLMEACDIMHNQREKIRQLKAVNNEFLCERNYVHEGSNASGDAPRDFDDNRKLQFKVLKAA
ncbi:hypothetical protein Bca101_071499 [Brassica carinata]